MCSHVRTHYYQLLVIFIIIIIIILLTLILLFATLYKKRSYWSGELLWVEYTSYTTTNFLQPGNRGTKFGCSFSVVPAVPSELFPAVLAVLSEQFAVDSSGGFSSSSQHWSCCSLRAIPLRSCCSFRFILLKEQCLSNLSFRSLLFYNYYLMQNMFCYV